MSALIKSGFCFFADLGNDKMIFENKFTGLRVMWDDTNKTYSVI